MAFLLSDSVLALTGILVSSSLLAQLALKLQNQQTPLNHTGVLKDSQVLPDQDTQSQICFSDKVERANTGTCKQKNVFAYQPSTQLRGAKACLIKKKIKTGRSDW